MKLSDYVIKFLEKEEVHDVFLLTGGGMMHLLDSLNSSKYINKYYNLNEQATGYAADAYAQTTNKLGVCFVTTGPGATNIVTGIASAHIDSAPILVISGQVRTQTMIGNSGVRQIGAQEVDIISMVKPITKYAITVMNAKDIRYHLEKAVFLATHGRKGAVWLDIPLDIQATDINENELCGYIPDIATPVVSMSDIDHVYELISQAKRPVILAGSGVFYANATADFVKLASLLQIPILSTYKFRRVASDLESELFFGSPGASSSRYSNYILQNSDLLIVIGSGLRYYVTAFNEDNFAPYAKKIVVNVDSTELKKLTMDVCLPIAADAKTFINSMIAQIADKYKKSDIAQWLKYCADIKSKYPVKNEFSRLDMPKMSSFAVYEEMKKLARFDDAFITVSSSTCILPFRYDFEPTKNQLFVHLVGLGAMGHALPAIIGGCIACDKKRCITFEGDGSLQHNIQELALINTYHLPIKLFVENNGGYAAIYNMQQNHFNGRLAGCTPESGICFPPLNEIATAYGIDYVSVKSYEEIPEKVLAVMKDDRPVICEIFTQIDFPSVLATKSRVLANGKMSTSSLEDLYPFLPEEEHDKNMISRVDSQ